MKLDNLNSMTKYPSIPTYHELGERGKLKDNIQVPFDDDEEVYITEKVDGTNARIILIGEDYFIGSREELLHAKGDRIWVPTEGIVNTLLKNSNIEMAYQLIREDAHIHVVFGEVYGGTTGQAKEYTGNKAASFRIFDLMTIPRVLADAMIYGEWTCQKIAAWRQNGGQEFVPIHLINGLGNELTTPRLGSVKGKELPKTHNDVLDWLQQYVKTRCSLDADARGKSEGVVIRNENRTKIAKIRFEDYERTLRHLMVKPK